MTYGLADAIRDEIRRGDLEARARHRQADAAARRPRETVSGEGGAEGTPADEDAAEGRPACSTATGGEEANRARSESQKGRPKGEPREEERRSSVEDPRSPKRDNRTVTELAKEAGVSRSTMEREP